VAAYTRGPAARQEVDRPRGRGFRRFVAMLALLGVLALIVIAAVLISNSTSNTVVHYRAIAGNDVHSAISQLQSLINQYTK
jgi:CHASE3 domain sensor protein